MDSVSSLIMNGK